MSGKAVLRQMYVRFHDAKRGPVLCLDGSSASWSLATLGNIDGGLSVDFGQGTYIANASELVREAKKIAEARS